MVYVPCLTLLKVHGSGYNSFSFIVFIFYSYDNIISYVCYRVLFSSNFKAASIHYNNVKLRSSLVQGQDIFRRTKKNYKAAKTVSIIVALFVISWFPSLITGFAHYFSNKVSYNSVYFSVWTFVESVAFTSSAFNPWVYCLRNNEFYEALSRTFRFLKRLYLRNYTVFGSKTAGTWLYIFITHNNCFQAIRWKKEHLE